MPRALALQFPLRHAQLRASPAAARAGRITLVAASGLRPETPTAPPREHALAESRESSNIVTMPQGMDAALSEGHHSKQELAAQAAAALEAENSWWQDTDDVPPNLVTATTPAEYKRLIVEAPRNQLVVVDYLKPSCSGCRRLFPKLLQVATSNPDALFVKVNVDMPELRELGQGMQVTHLPWFHFFRGGDLVASFSANVSTVSALRAEIAANKTCTDPGCSVY